MDEKVTDYPFEWLHGETMGRGDVARIFNVDPATVTRWAKSGVIGFFRAPGGNRVFPECEVRRVMAQQPPSDFVKHNAERDNATWGARWAAGWKNNGKFIISAPAEQGDDDD